MVKYFNYKQLSNMNIKKIQNIFFIKILTKYFVKNYLIIYKNKY